MYSKINENIKFIKEKNCNNLILRHSIREPIIDARNSQNQLLTKEGEQLAQYFGEHLPTNKKYNLFYSPVKRCEQTTDFIRIGLKNSNVEIVKYEENKFLTGFYVKSSDIMAEVNKISAFEFIKKWHNKEFTNDKMLNFIEAREIMLKSILNLSSTDKEFVNIHITHDWNIMLMYSYLHDIVSEKYIWPDFLQGVFTYDNNQLMTNTIKTKKLLF